MFDLTTYLNLKRKQIDSALENFLSDSDNRLVSAMKYSLMAGGKRLRPVLCIASAEALGGKSEDVLAAACALEMIHTYSLIHDDLPAMDDDELRRGKPTCHTAFDEATAILAGDALLTMAFEVLSSVNSITEKNAFKWLRVINEISKAAGYKGMIQGQMQDIAAEKKSLNLQALENMHRLKTGALINASVFCGAVLGNGTDEQIQALAIYAENIGLAFQVKDDILNVEGDPAVMGKAAGTDENRNKSTYPSIMGLDKSKAFAEELIHRAVSALDSFDTKSWPLRAIASYILQRKR